MKVETFFTPTSSNDDDSFDPNDDREPDKYVSEVKIKPQITRNLETVSFAIRSQKSRKSSVGETGGSSSQAHPKSVRSYNQPEKYLAQSGLNLP